MNTYPSEQEFCRLARRYNVLPVYIETVLDRETPVSTFERVGLRNPYAFLLESVEGGEKIGRYSILGIQPTALFISQGTRVLWKEEGQTRELTRSNPWRALQKIFEAFRPAPVRGLPRFWGGLVGYCAYDLVRFFERLSNRQPDVLRLPDCVFQLADTVLVFDRVRHIAQIIVCTHVPGSRQPSPKTLYRKARQRLAYVLHDLHRRSSVPPGVSTNHAPSVWHPERSRAEFLKAVEAAQGHIRAGDIIQAVLSQRWSRRAKAHPFQAYRALRLVNPSPYMYYLRCGDLTLVGSSPELLVRKEGRGAETRPIAGTRPRGATEEEDRSLENELRQDPKERAEHLMLVDLGRNDLGRVCDPGSVRVPEFMAVERYSHVMHLVSSVTGRLSTRASAFDLFEACFPAGTVAGAPKIRAMEIIEELEPARRGPYAGAVGYIAYNGNMDMAITIRTIVFKNDWAYVQAGAGIVADSVPVREYLECENKARALFVALERANSLP